jgi:hypothetical protein
MSDRCAFRTRHALAIAPGTVFAIRMMSLALVWPIILARFVGSSVLFRRAFVLCRY